MQKQFERFIEKHQLCSATSKIILAVSGGLDSMVMLDLFRKSGRHFVVAHVNFLLRGHESDRDESFVRDYCVRHGILIHCKRVETNNYATQHKLSIQMAARELRYEWFASLVREGVGDLVATAHHLTDSVETILLRVVHGAGAEGLSGIPVKNGHVIRPLMFATREELEDYAAANQITWREDLSNQTIDYQRNMIRQLVLPTLRLINPSLEETFQVAAIRSKGEQEIIDETLNQWKARFVELTPKGVSVRKEGLSSRKYPDALLFRVVAQYGFNFSTCVGMVDALWGQSGKRFISSTHQVVIDRESLLITPLAETLHPIDISSDEDTPTLGSFQLQIRERVGNDIITDPLVAVLDKDKVSFPLHWRTWKEGDTFYPLGMRGRKKVSDFLVDMKMSIPEKQSVTVIESGNQIIWLPGLRIDDRFKVTPETRTSLVLSLQKRSS